jgi:hypothetical protein
MPVTARLSKRLYDRLGDDVAGELVDWFNLVDASYRQDLKAFNELNFARFDAKVEQRFAESDARWEKRFAEADVKFERRFAEFRIEFAARETRLVRWMFAFWSANLVATAGLVLGVMRLR